MHCHESPHTDTQETGGRTDRASYEGECAVLPSGGICSGIHVFRLNPKPGKSRPAGPGRWRQTSLLVLATFDYVSFVTVDILYADFI